MTLRSAAPGHDCLVWVSGWVAALPSVSVLNRSLYHQPAGPPLSFLSVMLYEKVAASSRFSNTVAIVLQLSALIIVYKYCVFMGNC